MRNLITLAALLAVTSCSATQAPATVSGSGLFATQYVFRGVPQVDGNVFQATGEVAAEQSDGSTITGSAWANLNLSNDSGEAVFSDGNGGKVTEIDLAGDYSRSFDDVDASFGLLNYSFPNSNGASTTELYAAAIWDFMDLAPTVTLFWDIEEVDGVYLHAAIGRSFELEDEFSVDLGLSIGWMDDDQGDAYMGDDSSGLADLAASAVLNYGFNRHTTASISLTTSTVLDDDYEDALDDADIDSDVTWLTAGVSWSF